VLLSSIKKNAQHCAIQTESTSISYQQLYIQITDLMNKLASFGAQTRVALAINNTPAWLILDIAAMELGIVNVPLPTFFSDQQLQHAVLDSGANLLITDQPPRFESIFSKLTQKSASIDIAGQSYSVFHLKNKQTALPQHTSKITYTSGTTGNPKGVCLSKEAMLAVANAIQQSVVTTPLDHHLCVLPFATLLENVAGVYASFLGGACVHVYPSEQVGLNGSNLDIKQLHSALTNSYASTAIFIPELLKALVLYCGTGAPKPQQLRFLAVGGAHIATPILQQAQELGLAVYQGYGLSESASVVCLNTPASNVIGSVGKPLPHLQVKLSADNEILVKGANYLGYTHSADSQQDYINTGDIGYFDDSGHLFIKGRKKNIFITSYGRNVSPEWVETELTLSKNIIQACLFGEAKPSNTAIIVAKKNFEPEQLAAEIAQINHQLPDYAQVSQWLIADAPFSTSNQQLTANGRLKRDVIWQFYQDKINAIY
jgi:long-chain acyl-CoA synthetase